MFFYLLWLLFPLAFYCLVLGTLNRRAHPVAVSGAWDFVGVLCALAGFLLMGGPWLIDTLYMHDRDTVYQRDFENAAKDAPQVGHADPESDKKETVNEKVANTQALWWTVWVLYFVVVLGGAALLVWWRRKVLVIYNVEPQAFQEVLTRALERLGISRHQDGRHLVLRAGEASNVQEAACDIDTLALMCHVTMRWRRDEHHLRGRVEGELTRLLKDVQTYDNPAGGWFLSVASCLFGVILMGIVVVLLSAFLPLRR